MKRLLAVAAGLLLVTSFVGCAGVQRVALKPGVSDVVSIHRLPPDVTSLSKDQAAYLEQTLNVMDSDLVNSLNRRGFRASLIRSEKEAAGEGHLLKVTIVSHKLIPKGARFWVGMMAGADHLKVQYDLIDADGKTVLSWENLKASTESGDKCVRVLNREATEKIAQRLGSA